MAKSFSAQVGDWVQKSERRMEAVFKESTQRVIEEAQKTRKEGGRMRVDTGFLRASLMASTAAMPLLRAGARPAPNTPDNSVLYESDQVALVIAGAGVGDTIYAGYTAEYAAARESKDAFVTSAALKWQQIVNQVVAETRGRVR
ncbi:MAG: HK97 gp10 family phage protein [Hyphomicrobiales bacterium]|nr:HK97 gp10 family phage protein [Hyphomicrobiales bacterium]